MYNLNKPKTFKGIGLKWVEDKLCPNCGQGLCHAKATAKQTYQSVNVDWTIHISVYSEFCTDECGNYIFTGTFTPPIGLESLKEYSKPFSSETECVEYLFNTFYEVTCSN
jgi:hypothetical protein